VFSCYIRKKIIKKEDHKKRGNMANVPLEEVLKLMNSGMSDADIIRKMSEEGFTPVEISDALNQAKIKKEIAPEGLSPSIMQEEKEEKAKQVSLPAPAPSPPVPKPSAIAPSPPSITKEKIVEKPEEYPQPYAYPQAYPQAYPEQAMEAPRMNREEMEELAEEIVNEKWMEIKNKISDVIEWKAYAEKRMNSLDERLKRIELSIDRLQAALLSKVQEYGQGIKELGSEMHSLEGAFGKILNPLVENVKELSKITNNLKESSQKKLNKSNSKLNSKK